MTSFRKEQSVTCNFLNGCSFNIGHGNPTINNVIMDEEINSASECKGACVSYSKNNNFNLKMISYDKELLQCRCFDAVKRLLFRVVDIFKVKVKCSSGELFCDGKCISSDKICDGIPDCSKEIDEKLCRKALLDNMKCYYDQDFQSCPNKGFWWNKCEDNLKRKNVPTIPGSIHWNHDNIRSFKISLTKSRLNKTRVETCKDVFDQTHCLHTTRTVINPDGRGDIWVKCYFKHYFDRRQVYAVIFYRHQNLRETITTSDIINGTDFQRQFIWIGLENFAKLFYNKPRDLLVSRKGLGGVYYESILTNFQCTRDGKKVFFDAEKAGHASSREIGVFMQNTTFQFCNDSVQPYWWWGCRKIQPLYEKYTDETFVYISGHKSTHLWLSVIDDV